MDKSLSRLFKRNFSAKLVLSADKKSILAKNPPDLLRRKRVFAQNLRFHQEIFSVNKCFQAVDYKLFVVTLQHGNKRATQLYHRGG